MANTYKIFDGINWVDICDCNVHMKTISGWTKLDPRNCPTSYWNGTGWCPVTCIIPCSTCPEGYTLNSTSSQCEKFTAVDYEGTMNVISQGCNLVGTYGRYGLFLFDKFTFVSNSNIFFKARLFDAQLLNNSTGLFTQSLNILPYEPGTSFQSKFRAPLWYFRLASRGISRWKYKAWNKRSAYTVGNIVIVQNTLINKWEKYTCIAPVAANIVSPFNSNPSVASTSWSGPVALNYVYGEIYNEDMDYANATMVFKFCITLPATKTYHFGFAGDNRCSATVQINQTGPFQKLIDQREDLNHWQWYVVPIEFPAGTHVLELTGQNYGSVASIAFEIYDLNKSDDPTIDPVENFKKEFIYAPGTTIIDASAHTTDAQMDIEPYTIFTTYDMRDKEVPTPNEINPITSLPYTLKCPDGTPIDYCNGVPVCSSMLPCGSEIKIDSTTEINIWFDNSGSMNSTLTPLQTMQSTILKDCLLPIYNNDSALYDSKVRVIKMSEPDPTFTCTSCQSSGTHFESFIRCLAKPRNFKRTVDTTVGLVINLTFADESNDYGCGESWPDGGFLYPTYASRSPIYDLNVAVAKSNLATAALERYVIKGYAFRVATNPTIIDHGRPPGVFPCFADLTEATFENRGVYVPPYNLSVEAAANTFKYDLNTTGGAAPAYYKDKIIAGLQQLGISVPTCP